MKNHNKPESYPNIFRLKAERLLKWNPLKAGSQFFEANNLKLIHELEIYPIELKIQNKELKIHCLTSNRNGRRELTST